MKKIVEYRRWLDSTDFWYSRFDLLANQLTEYIINYKLRDKDFTKEVASKFEDVLRRCDEIDYQEYSTAIAYGILHFLPRYHRFQLIYSKLVDKGIFPPKKSPINILDVGTGPGPSLYALSDVYLSLKLFGDRACKNLLDEHKYIPDYVERSSGFRNWLHHFTEIANYKKGNDINGWIVPYHHGSFFDFSGIEFNQTYSYSDFDYEGDLFTKTRKRKFRYNIIVFSNFLTQLSQTEALRTELQNCMRFLRNRGKLIISGGTGNNCDDKSYPEMYKKIKSIILEDVYGNQDFVAKAKYVKIKRNKIEVPYDDKFGQRVKLFNSSIIKRFKEHDAIESIPISVRKTFLKTANPQYQYVGTSEFHVFEKYARHRSSFWRNVGR
jgi:hypothetical protein